MRNENENDPVLRAPAWSAAGMAILWASVEPIHRLVGPKLTVSWRQDESQAWVGESARFRPHDGVRTSASQSNPFPGLALA